MLWILFALYVCLVVFDAIGDATRSDRKIISHLAQSLFIASLLLLVIYYPGTNWRDHILILLLWYCVNRLFLFDPFWNITHNLISKREEWVYLDYIGGTGLWDIAIRWLVKKAKMPLFHWFFIKLCIWIAYNGWVLYNYKI